MSKLPLEPGTKRRFRRNQARQQALQRMTAIGDFRPANRPVPGSVAAEPSPASGSGFGKGFKPAPPGMTMESGKRVETTGNWGKGGGGAGVKATQLSSVRKAGGDTRVKGEEIGFFNATHRKGEPMKNLIQKLKQRRGRGNSQAYPSPR